MGVLTLYLQPTLRAAAVSYVVENLSPASAQSFLIEITATIFGRKDDVTNDGYVVDKILDKTGAYALAELCT